MRTQFDRWGAERMGYKRSSKTGAKAFALDNPVGSRPSRGAQRKARSATLELRRRRAVSCVLFQALQDYGLAGQT